MFRNVWRVHGSSACTVITFDGVVVLMAWSAVKPDDVMNFLLAMKPFVVAENKVLVERRFTDCTYADRFDVKGQDPKAYVTEADTHMNFLFTQISKVCGIPSYGEESLKERQDVLKKKKTYSLWDPVEGSGGFVNGLYESCGTLGTVINENNEPVHRRCTGS